MQRFQAGDLFALPIHPSEYLTGRVMLDVKNQCIKPKLIRPNSMLGFFNGSILIEIYKQTSDTPQPMKSDLLIPGVFVDPGAIQSKTWEIIGHEIVAPEDVDFPEAFVNMGRHLHFVKGEISLAVPRTDEDLSQIRGINRTTYPSSLFHEYCLFHLDRSDEINNSLLEDINFRNLGQSDLRLSEDREKVYAILELDYEQPYYQLALSHGFDVNRFYTSS